MKRLVEVPGVQKALELSGPFLVILTNDNLDDLYAYSHGSDSPQEIFLHPEIKPSSLYKLVEDYEGPLTVYCETQASDTVFRSRFSEIVSLRHKERTVLSFGELEDRARTLKQLFAVPS